MVEGESLLVTQNRDTRLLFTEKKIRKSMSIYIFHTIKESFKRSISKIFTVYTLKLVKLQEFGLLRHDTKERL